MRTLGLVVAGGRSTRFGADKATALLRGRPLIAHVVEALDGGCDAVAVNAPRWSPAAGFARLAGLPLIAEAAPHGGPLLGVLAGLRWAAERGFDRIVTAPCDVPILPADFVSGLVAAADPGGGAVAVDSRGRIQPLCALWRASEGLPLAAALQSGPHPAIAAYLETRGFTPVRFADPRAFANINAPADLALN